MTAMAPSTPASDRAQPSTDASARGGAAAPSPAAAALDGPTLDGLARTREHDAEVPRRVGRYTVLRHLGEGGMGQVLEAFDPELDRRVALKLLRVGRGGTAANQRLLREAQVMARISHPHVVQVYDAGLAGDRVFLAMELVRGRTLRQWLAAGPRPWREILRVLIEAGRGLAAAHAVGVIHRDFKPDNVLVGDDGRVRVADFGLANLERAAVAAARPANFEGRFVGLTQTGAIVGTPLYMAPEQHAGLELDARADQFSFCVALHEALLAAHPFAATTAIELTAAVMTGRYVAPPSRRGLPRALVRAIQRGLATDPARRFVDLEALLHALQRAAAPRRAGRWTLALVGGGALAATWLSQRDAGSCARGAARIDTVWSDDARATARALPPELGPVAATLEEYAGAWRDAWRQGCEGHRDGAISSARREHQLACLGRAESALAQLVALQDAPDVGDRLADAASALPAIAACDDHDAAAPAPAPERDALAGRIAAVEVLRELGRVDDARAELDALATATADEAFAPLRAELQLVLGRLEMDALRWPAAREALSLAARTALVAGRDELAAEALARRLFVTGVPLAGEATTTDDPELITALLHRAGDPPALVALAANNRGAIAAVHGELARARAEFEAALQHSDGAIGVTASDRVGYAINLALVTEDDAAREAAFDRAADVVATALGPNHLRALEVELRRARATQTPAIARARLDAVCPRVAERLAHEPFECAPCFEQLGEAAAAMGRTDEAIAAATAAVRCLEHAPGELPARVAATRARLLARRAWWRGDAATAAATLRDAAAPLREHAALPWIAAEIAGIERLQVQAEAALAEAQTRPPDREAVTPPVAADGRIIVR